MKPFPLIQLLASLLLTGWPQAILADCRVRVVATQQVVVVKNVVPVVEVFTPAIVAAFTPLAVAVNVPTFSIAPGYTPPTPAPAQPAAATVPEATVQKLLDSFAKRLDGLEQENKALRTRLQQLQPGPMPLAPEPAKPGDQASASGVTGLLQAKCAACHEAATAPAKGGGFTLLNGGRLAPLDGKAVAKVFAKSYGGSMPPKNSGIAPLTDQEFALVAQIGEAMK